MKAASTGEEGLALVEKTRPDLVLLDLILPKVDGFTVLARLKHNPRTSNVPIVVLTHLGMPETVDRAIRLGASAYLVKADVTPSHIVSVVRRTLGIT